METLKNQKYCQTQRSKTMGYCSYIGFIGALPKAKTKTFKKNFLKLAHENVSAASDNLDDEVTNFMGQLVTIEYKNTPCLFYYEDSHKLSIEDDSLWSALMTNFDDSRLPYIYKRVGENSDDVEIEDNSYILELPDFFYSCFSIIHELQISNDLLKHSNATAGKSLLEY
jgi:hypothetical protein